MQMYIKVEESRCILRKNAAEARIWKNPTTFTNNSEVQPHIHIMSKKITFNRYQLAYVQKGLNWIKITWPL